MDRLTQSVHFNLIQDSISTEKLADVYSREVVTWHRVSVSVILNRDVQFTSRFWKRFHHEMGTRLHDNMTFHPQTDDKASRSFKR